MLGDSHVSACDILHLRGCVVQQCVTYVSIRDYMTEQEGIHVRCEPLLLDVISQILFFFSSRRRHTRLQGDWSSDVCSSDLDAMCLADAFADRGEPAAALAAYTAMRRRHLNYYQLATRALTPLFQSDSRALG